MRIPRSVSMFRRFRVAWLSLTTVAVVVSSVQGAPKLDPKIKDAVTRAVAYLTAGKYDGADSRANEHPQRLGGICLIALAHLKAGEPETHPKVKAAMEACVKRLSTGEVGGEDQDTSFYSGAIALIFMAEIDLSRQETNEAPLFAPQIQNLIGMFQRTQKPNGAWTYRGRPEGDTSVTQYAILCTWMAKRAGAQIDTGMVQKTTEWLIRTQDPSGGWGYLGNESGGAGSGRIKQVQDTEHDLIEPSTCAAALGSLYICADLLNVRIKDPREGKRDSETPDLIVVDNQAKAGPASAAASLLPPELETALRTAIRDGDAWFDQNKPVKSEPWQHAYFYALERYESFREEAYRKASNKKPKADDDRLPEWYSRGAAFLLNSQGKDGSWTSRGGPAINTAFSVLFLARSTKQAIEKGGSGKLKGNRQLPADLTSLTLDGEGKIRKTGGLLPVDQFTQILADKDAEKLDAFSNVQLKLSDNDTERARQLMQLRKLVATGTYEARRVAVENLGRAGKVDEVPALIFALSDPDGRIVNLARDGLCYIARRFDGFGLPDQPAPGAGELNTALIKQVQEKWKDWYLSIRPDADLSFLE